MTTCVVKQEKKKYLIVNRSYAEFQLTARLEGTFYEARGGDVGNPYTFYLFITPANLSQLEITRLALYSLEGVEVLHVIAPVGEKTEVEADSVTYSVKLKGLNIDYLDYVLELNVTVGGVEKSIRVHFEKDHSIKYTTKWIERLRSV